MGLLLRRLIAGPVTLANVHSDPGGLALVFATAWIDVAALLRLRLALARVLRVRCRRPRGG